MGATLKCEKKKSPVNHRFTGLFLRRFRMGLRSPSPLSQLCGERTTTRVVGKSPLNTKNSQPELRILRLVSVYNCPKKYKIESQNGKYF